MKSLFTRKTFQYFDLAKKNKNKKQWFEKNKDLYEAGVKEPYSILIREIEQRFSRELPRIIINTRKISRPLRPANKAETMGYVKAGSMFYLSEKATSMFEWNPGIYMHLGDEKKDNVIGMGLYGPSSRQIKRLRSALLQDYKTIDKILADKKFKKYWKNLSEEKYKRFPKDYSVDSPAAKYLWYKQFFVSRHFTRKEVMSKEFPDLVINSFGAGIPLLSWIRDSIGVYNKREREREKEDALLLKD